MFKRVKFCQQLQQRENWLTSTLTGVRVETTAYTGNTFGSWSATISHNVSLSLNAQDRGILPFIKHYWPNLLFLFKPTFGRAWILNFIWETVISLWSFITRLFNNSSFAVSNLGLATVVEFDALPETECDIISCSVKSLRINILTVFNTEVELEFSSLHTFSSSENSDSGSWSALPEVLFNFLSVFWGFSPHPQCPLMFPSTFQDVAFDGLLLPLFISWCYNHGIKKLPNHWWTRWYYFRDPIGYHSNTMAC